MKRILLFVMLATTSVVMLAVPAKRMKQTLTLSDGTKIEAMLIGDEHGHWFVDNNGNALQLRDGVACYLSAYELNNLKAARNERARKSNARRIARMESRRSLSRPGMHKVFGEPTTIKGQKKGVVILVNFSDKKFNASNTQSLFNDRFNKVGYNASGYVGSVHDYFYDQSYGQFDLTFDVVGPVTLSKQYSYYGGNDSDGNDEHPGEMVIEAVKLANSQVNFADYDWDGDGEVDQVFCIYAGQGEASSDDENTIWPHEYSLSACNYYGDGSGPQTLDGVKVDTYAVSCELADASTIDGIGTACHEFSHCLGYADHYDTDYSGGPGMMYWDLMDGGSYNGPNDMGEVPAPFTSFERWWAGWMELTELDSPCKISGMKPLTSEPEAYAIYNQKNRNEYYLLENHQGEKWDSYTGGHGMMILHVDYDKSVWQENAPNDDPSRQRMTFIPADNSYGTKRSWSSGGTTMYQWSATFEQIAGDPWPGKSNKTSFTDTTTPAATLYNANTDGRKYMGKPIENIAEGSDGLISFIFDGGIVIPTPNILAATDVTTTGFTANWEAVDEATSYNLEVVEQSNSGQTETSFSEDFSRVSVTSDGTTDVGSSLDTYTNQSGWTGSKVYLAPGGLKLGSSKAAGSITTPLIDKSSDGNVTVSLNLKKYGTDAPSVEVALVNSSDNVIGTAQTCSPGEVAEDFDLEFTGITSDYKIQIKTSTSKKRFYLYSVQVGGSKDKVYSYNTTATSYTVSGLSDTNYKYRVQAVSAEGQSHWSDYQQVDIPTRINEINGNGVNTVNNVIYNINGQRMNAVPQHGVYIQNGRKVIK